MEGGKLGGDTGEKPKKKVWAGREPWGERPKLQEKG